MADRQVKRTTWGHPATDGAGVQLQRVLGPRTMYDFDPFLMLDAFDSSNPADYIKGFPWHPHRGIETVTYLIEGDIEHGDSLGNSGSIKDGSCQWMTAGGGIIHQEMPKKSKRMLGAQLWINLPAKDKMTEPAYNDIQPSMVPKVEEEGVTVAVVSGSYGGKTAKMQGNFVKTTYLDVDLSKGAAWKIGAPEDKTVFIYIIDGSVDISGQPYAKRTAVLFGPGDTVSLSAGDSGARFLFLSASPLKEPIAWGGPIVMNTQEELDRASAEIEAGTFAKDCRKAARGFYKN